MNVGGSGSGARDESDALIRLADSMAGFIRDAIKGTPYAIDLFKAVEEGVFQELK